MDVVFNRRARMLVLVADVVVLMAGALGLVTRQASAHTASNYPVATTTTTATPSPVDLRSVLIDLQTSSSCCTGGQLVGKQVFTTVDDATVHYHPCVAHGLSVARWGSTESIKAVERCIAAIPAEETVLTSLRRLGFSRMAQEMWDMPLDEASASSQRTFGEVGVIEFDSDAHARSWMTLRHESRAGHPSHFAAHLPDAFGSQFKYEAPYYKDNTLADEHGTIAVRRVEFRKGPRCYFVSVEYFEPDGDPRFLLDLARRQYRLAA